MGETNVAPPVRLGLVLTGEFLSTEQQADRSDAETGKTYAGRWLVKLLTGDDRVISVEYRNKAVQEEMVGPILAERGDVVTLPVGVRSAKGYTFYFGRSAS